MTKREFVEQIMIERMSKQPLTLDFEIDEETIEHSLNEYSKAYDILNKMFPELGLGELGELTND